MFSLKKILLPVDFSERCLGAARYAEALSGHFHSEIHLVHVLEPMRYEFSTLEFGGTVMNDLAASRTAQAHAQLDGFLSDELTEARLERALLEGDPAQKIIEYAHSARVDLITMSTHGYGPFRRFILGSVTAKVLHDADCPVWTGVHMEDAHSAAAIQLRNVVCAVDLGPMSKKALCWAAQLASEFHARLILVHAVASLEGKPGEYHDPDWKKTLTEMAREQCDKLKGELAIQPEVYIEGGDPPGVVCAAAEQFKADVLVIGRGSAAGVFGRLRTNAYAIIRQSPCPVVSV